MGYNARAARPPAARPSAPPHTDHPSRAPTRPPQGKTYYEYTCCPDDGSNHYGSNQYGEECGDFDPSAEAAGLVVGIVFIVFLLIGIICGVLACCYCCPGCPWYQSYVDRAGMRVRWG